MSATGKKKINRLQQGSIDLAPRETLDKKNIFFFFWSLLQFLSKIIEF